MRTECPLCGSPVRSSWSCLECGLVFRLEAPAVPVGGPGPVPPAPPAPHTWASGLRPADPRPSGTRATTKPASYLGWAIASLVLCCVPLGIVAVVYAARVDALWMSGNHTAAAAASRKARAWVLATATVGIVGLVLYALLVVRTGATPRTTRY